MGIIKILAKVKNRKDILRKEKKVRKVLLEKDLSETYKNIDLYIDNMSKVAKRLCSLTRIEYATFHQKIIDLKV